MLLDRDTHLDLCFEDIEGLLIGQVKAYRAPWGEDDQAAIRERWAALGQKDRAKIKKAFRTLAARVRSAKGKILEVQWHIIEGLIHKAVRRLVVASAVSRVTGTARTATGFNGDSRMIRGPNAGCR